MPRAVELIPDKGISKLNCFILIAPVLWTDNVEDSVKVVRLQELYGEKYYIKLCKCLHFL